DGPIVEIGAEQGQAVAGDVDARHGDAEIAELLVIDQAQLDDVVDVVLVDQAGVEADRLADAAGVDVVERRIGDAEAEAGEFRRVVVDLGAVAAVVDLEEVEGLVDVAETRDDAADGEVEIVAVDLADADGRRVDLHLVGGAVEVAELQLAPVAGDIERDLIAVAAAQEDRQRQLLQAAEAGIVGRGQDLHLGAVLQAVVGDAVGADDDLGLAAEIEAVDALVTAEQADIHVGIAGLEA